MWTWLTFFVVYAAGAILCHNRAGRAETRDQRDAFVAMTVILSGLAVAFGGVTIWIAVWNA
jgi:hypothetical protein